MKNAQLRLAQEQELSIIRSIAEVVWPDTFGEILSSDQIDYMLNWMYDVKVMQEKMKHGDLFYLLFFDQVPVGYAHVERNVPTSECLRIHKLYLLPSTQGKGLGQFFVDELSRIALEMDLFKLHLNVNRFNKSVGFYHHVGFKTIDEVDNDIGSGYLMEDYVMTKNLI